MIMFSGRRAHKYSYQVMYNAPSIHCLVNGSKAPWKVYQNYIRDIAAMRFGALDDGTMEYRKTIKQNHL